MGRHNAPTRPSRAVSMVGGTAAALATVASVAALQTIPVSSAEVYEAGPTQDAGTALASESSQGAGPLAIPSIGVVAPGFDRLVTLLGLPTTTPASEASDFPAGTWTQPTQRLPLSLAPDDAGPVSTDPPDQAGTPDPSDIPDPTDPSETPDPTDPSETPDPTDPSETPDPTDPSETPDPTDPSVTPDPTDPSVTPDPTDPSVTPDPTDPTDPTETPDPTDPVPAADVVLAVGETFAVVDPATGAASYSITVVGVTLDAGCTAPEAVAAEYGHFVMVQLLVSPVSDMAAGVSGAAFDAMDFSVAASDGTVTTPATAAAASCLTDAERLPAGTLAAGSQYAGTVVLDVPSPTGSIVHRPDPTAAGAVWLY